MLLSFFLTYQQHMPPILAPVRLLYTPCIAKGPDIFALLQFLTSGLLNIYKFSQPELELDLPKDYQITQCPTWTLKGGDPPPIHSTGEATSEALGPVLVSSEPETHGHTGARCVKDHKDDEGTHEEWLNQLGLFCLERAQEDWVIVYKYLKEVQKRSQAVERVRTRDNGHKAKPRRVPMTIT